MRCCLKYDGNNRRSFDREEFLEVTFCERTVFALLCQNCGAKDAIIHFKHIKNGEAQEIHLCAHCAVSLGYSELFPGLGFFAFDFFGSEKHTRELDRELRCEVCGFSLEDINRSGHPGCPDCYRVFRASLSPILLKLHGNAPYRGRSPKEKAEQNEEAQIMRLQAELERAIAEQRFEDAATLRDKIKALYGGEY